MPGGRLRINERRVPDSLCRPEQDDTGAAHIFVRNGRQLEIFQALDSAKPDEMPQLYPGKREWVLEKQL